MNRDTPGEGSLPTQEERDWTIFWGDNQGPVVMVWDGMLPGEQESAKKIITDETDWIIWRVKPPRGASGEQVGTDRQSQETTDSRTAWDKIRGNQTEGKKGPTDFIECLQRRIH